MHNNKPTDLKNASDAIQWALKEDISHQSSLAHSDKYNALISLRIRQETSKQD